MAKAIILDYDGVIRFADEEKVAEILETKGFEPSTFFQMLWGNSHVNDLITGKIDRKTWWAKLQNLHPELQKVDDQFLWDEVFVFPVLNDDLLEKVQKLKQQNTDRLKLAILSNADAGSKDIIEDQVKEYDFDLILTSSDVGIAKPDEKIYKEAIRLLDCTAKDVVFFDDNKNNVESANEFGMNAYFYQDLQQFDNIVSSFL